MQYMCGKLFCENLEKIISEWLHFHVKIKYLKIKCTEMLECIKWKTVQNLDGNWSVRNLLWSIPGPQAL